MNSLSQFYLSKQADTTRKSIRSRMLRLFLYFSPTLRKRNLTRVKSWNMMLNRICWSKVFLVLLPKTISISCSTEVYSTTTVSVFLIMDLPLRPPTCTAICKTINTVWFHSQICPSSRCQWPLVLSTALIYSSTMSERLSLVCLMKVRSIVLCRRLVRARKNSEWWKRTQLMTSTSEYLTSMTTIICPSKKCKGLISRLSTRTQC